MHTPPVSAHIFSPFIYTRLTARKTNFVLILLVSIQFAVLLIARDFFAVVTILFAVAGSSLVEYWAQYRNAEKLTFSFEAVITGLLIGFFMPVKIGFVFTFFVSALSVFISKSLYGGTGSNWINPTVIAACIAYISRPDAFPPVLSHPAFLKEKGSMFAVLESYSLLHIKSDFAITSAFNSIFLHGAGVTLPEGYVTLFLNSTSPIPAFRYNFITLLSSVVLFSLRVADYIFPAIFIFVYATLVWTFAQVPVTGIYFSGDILAALLTSGILFAAFFVLTESSSAPKTKYGKAVCGIIAGIFAFFICGAGASPAGTAFTLLITNIFTPLIEKMEVKIQALKRKLYE